MKRTLLQITDCHLVADGDRLVGVDTQASLESVLAQACRTHEVDAVVATGDLAHLAEQSVYERFEETVRRYTDAPLLCLPGNHDILNEMTAAGLPMRTLELGAWSVVALDSHIDDTVQSEVTKADRARTAAAIARAQGAYLLVATHHPLVAVNCPWLDKDRIQNAEELVVWLSECAQAQQRGIALRGVIFGHAHQAVSAHSQRMQLPVQLLGSPSTCFQFLPESPQFALDASSPGYRVLELSDDGTLVSTVERTDFPIDPTVSR